MKLNIAPTDCRYIVDKNKNKVICIIEDTERLFLKFVYSNFNVRLEDIGDAHFYIHNYNFTKKFLMPRRFVGIATCSETDEWDEETGKLIAYSRAKDNLNKSFFKRANLYINSLDKEIDRAAEVLNILGQKLEINTARRHEKISSIIGEE